MKLTYILAALELIFLCSFVFEVTEARREKHPRCPRLRIKNGRVRMRSRGKMAHFGCKRGFSLIGPKFSVCLRNSEWSVTPPVCAGKGCPKLVNSTDTLKIKEENSGSVLKFQCSMGLTRTGPESLYCDGKDWNAEPPVCVRVKSMECDFDDKSLCGWSNDMDDDFDWTLKSGGTPTANTGPTVDHTTNTSEGFYMYIESSAPQRHNFKARLLSPMYTPDQLDGVCFKFFYHMFGPPEKGQVGTLDLLVARIEDPSEKKKIFHKEGNMGDSWQLGDVDIPKTTQPIQFIFEATRLRGWASDIAIDDIQLYNCSERPVTEETTIELSTEAATTKPTTTTPTTLPTTSSTSTMTTSSVTSTTRSTSRSPSTTTSPTTKPTTTTSTTLPTTSSTSTTTTSTTSTTATSSATSTTRLPNTSTLPTTVRTTTSKPSSTTRAMASSTSSSTTTTPGSKRDTTTRPTKYTTRTQKSTPRPTISTQKRKTFSRSTTPSTTLASSPSSGFGMTDDEDKLQTPSIDYAPDDNNSNNSVTRSENNDKAEDGDATATTATMRNNPGGGDGNVRIIERDGQTGQVRGNSGASSGTMDKLPLILGVTGGVLALAVIVAVAAYAATKRKEAKARKREEEDQMNIINDYVETNLNL